VAVAISGDAAITKGDPDAARHGAGGDLEAQVEMAGPTSTSHFRWMKSGYELRGCWGPNERDAESNDVLLVATRSEKRRAASGGGQGRGPHRQDRGTWRLSPLENACKLHDRTRLPGRPASIAPSRWFDFGREQHHFQVCCAI